MKTSTYKGYVIELDKVVDDSSMIFDELLKPQLSNNIGILEFAPESASIKDYLYMIDMIYRNTVQPTVCYNESCHQRWPAGSVSCALFNRCRGSRRSQAYPCGRRSQDD